jgi:hypothetical protein
MSSPLKDEIFESVAIIPTRETDLDIFLQNKTNNLERIYEMIEPPQEPEHINDKIINVTEKFVHKGIEEVKEKLSDIGIKTSTMHLVIKYVIEAVEKFPTTGQASKDLALRIIKDLVDELPDSSEKEFILETLNNGLISDTIDLIISATKGDLDINVVQYVVFTCIPSCINYFRKRREKNKKKKAVKKAMMEEEE